ncbi:MAG: hypothetical protein R3301_11195 [Saprospiraceae bacterium]|nr:hypothetical protein [Saprospiraceae bacterium]
MQYKKLKVGDTVIEFHNNWLGEETVIVNGQVVSKKSSIMGTHHHFNVLEDGHHVRYVLTTKVSSGFQVLLDLRRNGQLIQEDVVVPTRFGIRKPRNTAKKTGLIKLNEYDLEGAIEELIRARDVDPDDPEIYFYLACAYSVLERPREGFEHLRLAVKHRLQDPEMILNHDMLAYLRLQDAFEDFFNSNFTEYDPDRLSQ